MRNQPEVREQMFKLIEQWQQSSYTKHILQTAIHQVSGYFIISIKLVT